MLYSCYKQLNELHARSFDFLPSAFHISSQVSRNTFQYNDEVIRTTLYRNATFHVMKYNCILFDESNNVHAFNKISLI